MLHHRTNDPAVRAWHIAQRTAEQVWQQTGDVSKWSATVTATHDQVLEEMQPEQGGKSKKP